MTSRCKAIAVAFTALMLTAMIAPLAYSLQPVALERHTKPAAFTASGAERGEGSKGALIARIIICSVNVRNFLKRLNTNVSNVTDIEVKLGVNKSVALLLQHVASINISELDRLDISTLKEEAAKTVEACRIVGLIAKKIAEERRARIEKKMLERIEERIDKVLETLNMTVDKANITKLIEELKEAVRSGDVAKAREAMAKLAAIIRVVHIYRIVEKIKHMVEMQANITNTSRGQYCPPLRIIMPLKMVERLEKILKKNLRIISLVNASAAKELHEIIIKIKSDIGFVKVKLSIMRKAAEKAARLCINETLAEIEKVKAEIERLKANNTNVSIADLKRAEMLVNISEELLSLAIKHLEKGNVRAALMLCGHARLRLVEAQLILAVASGGQLSFNISITIPPWIKKAEREELEKAVERAGTLLLRLNETLVELYEEAVKVNASDVANMTLKLMERVNALWSLYLEAQKLVEAGNTTTALKLLARVYAGIAGIVHGVVIAKAKLEVEKHLPKGKGRETGIGKEEAEKLRAAIRELKANLTRLLDKVRKEEEKAKSPVKRLALKMVEESIKKAINMLDKAEKLLERNAVEAAKKLFEIANNIYENIVEKLRKLLGG